MAGSLPLAATLGEPAGIGPEVLAMAWRAMKGQSRPASFYCIGDPAFLGRRFDAAGLSVPVRRIEAPGAAEACFAEALPVLPLARSTVASGRPGVPSTADAPAVLESIETAVTNVHQGLARAVVTSPIHKETLYEAGFDFPGHTEYLAALTADWTAGGSTPVMMLASDVLRVVPVTIHVPLAQVPGLLSEELVAITGQIVARELRERFGIARPRLAVAGLNPHAGEGGRMGREDLEIIAPAVAKLAAADIETVGPLSADTMFHAAARARYDVALTMYHDQALIPIKTLSFDDAVNITLGLPLIRTSPDHGTALPLAESGKASAASMLAALRMADRLSRPQ